MWSFEFNLFWFVYWGIAMWFWYTGYVQGPVLILFALYGIKLSIKLKGN